MMKLSEAASVMGAQFVESDGEFSAVTSDSRQCQLGTLFFALKGDIFDGHDFIEAAREAGAIAAVVSHDVESSMPLLRVADSAQALGQLASHYRQHFIKSKLVAVTGSVGKTTTRALLASVFAKQGNTHASVKSYNNEIGVPLTLLSATPKHEFIVVEMGANHSGEIAYLTQLAKPNVAIITNAAESHLEGFGDVQGVAAAKGEIYQGLSEDGVAIINADDHFANFWEKLSGQHRVVTFGINHDADVMARNIHCNESVQPSFQLCLPDGEVEVTLTLLGKHNVMNALAAAAAGYALGLSKDTIKAGLESASAEYRRLNITLGFKGATVIDDSYNANPCSVRAAIDVLAEREGRVALVLGDMLELGENSLDFHRDLGELAMARGLDRLFCYGEKTRSTAQAFGKGGAHYDDKDVLIQDLKNYLDQDITVLIKGSNSMGMDQVTKAITETS